MLNQQYGFRRIGNEKFVSKVHFSRQAQMTAIHEIACARTVGR
jgi:hypothetical protein